MTAVEGSPLPRGTGTVREQATAYDPLANGTDTKLQRKRNDAAERSRVSLFFSRGDGDTTERFARARGVFNGSAGAQ
jgi:hypothetical protein